MSIGASQMFGNKPITISPRAISGELGHASGAYKRPGLYDKSNKFDPSPRAEGTLDGVMNILTEDENRNQYTKRGSLDNSDILGSKFHP